MSTGSGLPRPRTSPRSADVRADRLVDILLRLTTGRSATASGLAEEVKVAVRTMYRDLADLQTAGFPLWTGPGPGGGVRLVDSWITRFHDMTRDEATALLLRVTPTTPGPLGLATAAAAARHRNGLPPEAEARSVLLAERCLLDAPGWFRRPDDVPHLPIVSCAVWDGYRVKIEYGRGESPEVIDPLGLVIRSGRWFVVASVHGSLRSYRVNRLTQAEICEEPIIRPDDFVLSEWWIDSPAQLDGVATSP